MDISSIVPVERTIDIKHPQTGDPVGLRVNLLPDSHPKVEEARRKFLNERLQRGVKLTADKLQAQQLAIIVAAVSGWEWEGEATFHGEKPEFTDGKLRSVLKELPWIKAQLDEELGDNAAFFPN